VELAGRRGSSSPPLLLPTNDEMTGKMNAPLPSSSHHHQVVLTSRHRQRQDRERVAQLASGGGDGGRPCRP
jgi:hypothetical protein